MNINDYYKIDSSAITNTVDFINKNQIKSIAIGRNWNYTLLDVSFLKDCQFVENIIILGEEYDISGISYCRNLKYLQTDSSPVLPIDLSEFIFLKELRIEFNKNWVNLYCCAELEKLALWKCKESNLKSFSNLGKLKFLELIKSKIESLEYIESLNYINKLHLVNANKFAEIGSKSFNKSLETIHFENTPTFRDYESLKSFPNLRELIVSKSGNMKDVFFVEQLLSLKKVSIKDCNIENGNIDSLKKIPNIFFEQKKHYSFNLRDFMLNRLTNN